MAISEVNNVNATQSVNRIIKDPIRPDSPIDVVFGPNEQVIRTSDGTIVHIPSNEGRIGAPEVKVRKLGDQYLVSTKPIVPGAKPEYRLLSEEEFLNEYAPYIVYSPKDSGTVKSDPKKKEDVQPTEETTAADDTQKAEDKKLYQYSLAYKVADAVNDGDYTRYGLASLGSRTADAIKNGDFTKFGAVNLFV